MKQRVTLVAGHGGRRCGRLVWFQSLQRTLVRPDKAIAANRCGRHEPLSLKGSRRLFQSQGRADLHGLRQRLRGSLTPSRGISEQPPNEKRAPAEKKFERRRKAVSGGPEPERKWLKKEEGEKGA